LWAGLHIKIAVEAAKKFFRSGNGRTDKVFYGGKIEGAKFFINRITGLVPAKLENLKKDDQSAMNILKNHSLSRKIFCEE